MERRYLEKIGLTKNESIVYTTLLKLGISKTGEILKKSGLNSGKIYEILESLKFSPDFLIPIHPNRAIPLSQAF